jgi:predicted nicotinamide N-methyase
MLGVTGRRVVELGAGLGLPSLSAALCGADVLATDWADEAVSLLRANAKRNSIRLGVKRVRWDEPDALLRAAPWDVVLGADLLYEQRNAKQLLDLLPRLGGEIVLADPGRPFAKEFLSHWAVEELAGGVFRLRLP